MKNDHAALKYQILLMLQQNGPLTETEITHRLADIIGMDEEELDECYENRPNDKVFYKCVAIDEQDLKAAGLVEFSGNYGLSITDIGARALVDNEKTRRIEYDYLLQFKEMIKGTKILDYSDIKYGILRVNSGEIAENLPVYYYPIFIRDVNNPEVEDEKKHMHLSVRNRIDGFTAIYKRNKVKIGDTIEMGLMREEINNETKYILKVSFRKGKDAREEVADNVDKHLKELKETIIATQDMIKKLEFFFYKNEINVRAEIVERILKVLDWSFPAVQREQKGRGSIKVDFALYKPEGKYKKCKALIEVKSMDTIIDKDDSNLQLMQYLKDERFSSVPVGILTNGRTWIIYDRKGNEIKRTDIVSNEIKEEILPFFNCLHFDEIENLENMEHSPSPHFKHESSKEIEISFKKSGSIRSKNASEVFREFIRKKIDDNGCIVDKVLELQNNNYFSIEILSKKGDKINKCKTTNGETWYINVDTNTDRKLMIIKQIISEAKIEAEIIGGSTDFQ